METYTHTKEELTTGGAKNKNNEINGTEEVNLVGNMFKLLSINKVRKLLGISYNKTLKLINSGEIEYVKIGSKLMVPIVKLWNYVNNSKNINEQLTKKFDSIENEINSILKEEN